MPKALFHEDEKDLWLNFFSKHVSLQQEIGEELCEHFDCVCVHIGQGEHIISQMLSMIGSDPSKGAEVTDNETLNAVENAVFLSLGHDEESTSLKVEESKSLHGRLAAVVIKNGKLMLGNVYNINEQDDVVYYSMQIYENLNMPKHTPAFVDATIDEQLEKQLNKYIKTHRLTSIESC